MLIVLVGLMGSGKTTVGRQLAKKLSLKFVDSDELVEERAKSTVREIFAQLGEPEFRRLESEALQTACVGGESKVLAVAGGAVLAEANRTLLLKNAKCIVWLDAPTSTLVDRTRRAKHRPLLDNDPTSSLNKMRQDREDLYRQIATHVVATASLSINQVVDRIVEQCCLTAVSGGHK